MWNHMATAIVSQTCVDDTRSEKVKIQNLKVFGKYYTNKKYYLYVTKQINKKLLFNIVYKKSVYLKNKMF